MASNKINEQSGHYLNSHAGQSEQKATRGTMHENSQTDIQVQNDQPPHPPKVYFFYGSLTDSLQLQEVLRLPALPALKPARVTPYKIKLWGQYPALGNGPANSFVDGKAYLVETEQQEKMLEYYETDAYMIKDIEILVDGKVVQGRTFVWADKYSEELTEGTWSLEEWRKGVEEEMASHFRPVED